MDKYPSQRFCLFWACIGRALGPISLVLVPYPWNIGTYYFFSGLIGNAFGILQSVFGNHLGQGPSTASRLG